MKKFFCRFVAVALALAFVGCSNEDLNDESTTSGGGSESKDAVYMNVTVQLPVKGVGSRSQTNTEFDENGEQLPDNKIPDYGTSTGGTEVGWGYENAVKEVLLVLAKKSDVAEENNKIIASGVSSGSDLSVANSIVTSTHKISKTALAHYYGDAGSLTDNERKINVYVFCNPTSKLKKIVEEATDNKWVDATAELEETSQSLTGGDIWGGSNHQGGFLMSTARSKDLEKELPSKLSMWNVHINKKDAFDLTGNNNYSEGSVDNSTNGSIGVERAVARFDFKDGSPANTGANTYDVVEGEVKIDNVKQIKTFVQIELTKMALVNMSKKFYYLRRVSADGMSTNATLCGTETSSNYVVDWDAADKQLANLNAFKFADHFNFCLGHGETVVDWTIDATARGQWYSSDITTVLNDGADDNPEGGSNKGKYKIWRYVTENTIPKPVSGSIAQRHGISTGIVFKGKMKTTDYASKSLKDAINGATGNFETDPILYAYSNNLFVRWKEVREYAIKNKEENYAFYQTVFGNPINKVPAIEKEKDGVTTEAVYSDDKTSPDYKWDAWYNGSETGVEKTNLLKDFKQAATSAQFTLYQSAPEKDGEIGPGKGGYYCYYYYWNRHNDNENPTQMRSMEFAVVRNNVYKLAVTEIGKLGHPRISENDPDPEDPDKPDESSDVYLKLSVQVLPWVVRENNIVF